MFFKHLDLKKIMYQIWILASSAELRNLGINSLHIISALLPRDPSSVSVRLSVATSEVPVALSISQSVVLLFFFFISAIQAGHIFLICLHVH